MEVTKAEWSAICVALRDLAKKHGEDIAGAVLKTSGGRFLTLDEVAVLAKKVDETDTVWHRDGWPEPGPYVALRRV